MSAKTNESCFPAAIWPKSVIDFVDLFFNYVINLQTNESCFPAAIWPKSVMDFVDLLFYYVINL